MTEGFEYNATTNQLSVDNLNVNHLTSSFITSSQIFTSGSNIFGDASSDTVHEDKPLLWCSFLKIFLFSGG